jgi:hypothetical protein
MLATGKRRLKGAQSAVLPSISFNTHLVRQEAVSDVPEHNQQQFKHTS